MSESTFYDNISTLLHTYGSLKRIFATSVLSDECLKDARCGVLRTISALCIDEVRLLTDALPQSFRDFENARVDEDDEDEDDEKVAPVEEVP